MLTGILFGLVPAISASRTNLAATLNESSNRSGVGFRSGKVRSVLVVSEMALALVLVIGAALLIRTFMKLQAVDPGFDTHNVLTMAMSISGDRFQKSSAVAQIIRDGTDRLNAVPGVTAAAAACCLPLQGGFGLPFNIVGRAKETIPTPEEPDTSPSHGAISMSSKFPSSADAISPTRRRLRSRRGHHQ